MANKTFTEQFRKDLYTLTRAGNREIELDYEHPKLYRKVKKYFKEQGVQFYDEPDADFEYVLSLIAEELKLEVPA